MKSQKKSVKISVIRVIRVLWKIWSRQRFPGIIRDPNFIGNLPPEKLDRKTRGGISVVVFADSAIRR